MTTSICKRSARATFGLVFSVAVIVCSGQLFADPPKAAEPAKAADAAKPAEKTKADQPAKKDDAVKPAEKPKPQGAPKTEPAAKPAEKPKADEPAKKEETPKKDDSAKPADMSKADAPKKEEPAKSAEKPKDNSAKPAEKPKADEAPKKEEPPKKEVPDDPDFAMLGEFRGSVTVSKAKSEVIGLQIRPTGGGGFEAAQYLGGLPGERAQKSSPTLLIGKRAGDFLVLSGGPWAILAHADHCWLVDSDGKRVGSLERVERHSPTLDAKAPKEAIVLFDGTNTDRFVGGRMTDDGLLMEGTEIRQLFHDFDLHLEFKLCYMPTASGQARSNSGIYLQSRYEVQVLDSFGLDPANNDCGSLYTYRKPDVNMCLPPLVWQTYDIAFTSARWASDGTKLADAKVTVWLNGVKVQDNISLPDKTGAGKPEDALLLPIKLQDHHNPVRYRNIWIIDRGLAPARDFPPFPKAKKAPALAGTN